MSSTNKILLLEFNELCPPLLKRWMDGGLLPNFKRFAEQSNVFVTQADEPEGDSLNPWIQWYSVHTGLPYSVHRVFRLTDGLRAKHADVWSVLADAGVAVGNMSSMNAAWSEGRRGFYVPDPWCGEQVPAPRDLAAYHSFVSQQVQGHSAGAGARLSEARKFLGFMLGHGLSFKTIRSVLSQLLSEVVSRGRVAWRRASLLDLFQFDVFRHYLRQAQPRFATFFINSTAHYQHCYWRHMEPEQFKIKPSAEEHAQYKDAVLYGYQRMDALLGDFFKLEQEGYTLVLATALSQQPYLAAEERGGQLYYRPLDFEAFLRSHGIAYSQLEPVMAQQFVLRFPHRAATEKAAEQLRGFEWNGTQVIEVSDEGGCSLNVANWLHGAVPEDAVLTSKHSQRQERYYDVFYRMEAMKSGRHHRDGVLWIKTGKHQSHTERVSILEIFPTLLDLLGVPVPAQHRGPSQSLLRRNAANSDAAPRPAARSYAESSAV